MADLKIKDNAGNTIKTYADATHTAYVVDGVILVSLDAAETVYLIQISCINFYAVVE